jgi:hypothetical protein
MDPIRRESKFDDCEFVSQEILCGFTLRNPFSGKMVDLKDNVALVNETVRRSVGQHFCDNTSVLYIPLNGKSNTT